MDPGLSESRADVPGAQLKPVILPDLPTTWQGSVAKRHRHCSMDPVMFKDLS